jgi:hypothetical protein
MEPYWSSPGFFGTQFAGSMGIDLFYDQEIASPGILLANSVGAALGTLVTDQIMANGKGLAYFMDRDAKVNHGKPIHLTRDLYSAIALGVVGGTTANVLVRHYFFAVPWYPAVIAGVASAALSWGIWVQPRLTSVTAGLPN